MNWVGRPLSLSTP